MFTALWHRAIGTLTPEHHFLLPFVFPRLTISIMRLDETCASHTFFSGSSDRARFFVRSDDAGAICERTPALAMEAVEALSVLLMALFLLHGNEGAEQKLIPPALGFLAMGILNTVHAASLPGDQFVFLRALANLAGGLGFSFSWLPASRQARRSPDHGRPVITAFVSLAVCLLVYLFPSALPLMVHEGAFTAPAVAINVLAGMLFLAGTVWFMRRAVPNGCGRTSSVQSYRSLFRIVRADLRLFNALDGRPGGSGMPCGSPPPCWCCPCSFEGTCGRSRPSRPPCSSASRQRTG